jgi:hypothetical protein
MLLVYMTTGPQAGIQDSRLPGGHPVQWYYLAWMQEVRTTDA